MTERERAEWDRFLVNISSNRTYGIIKPNICGRLRWEIVGTEHTGVFESLFNNSEGGLK